MKQAAPAGWRLAVHETLCSTQDIAIAAAQAGGADHLAVLANRQSAGRGSHGRQWAAPEGNLNLSIVLADQSRRLPAGMYALFAGVVLHTAVARLLQDSGQISLKWPNDLMLNHAKLGGILIDSAANAAGGLAWIVIGMGVNLESAPEVAGRQTACLGGRVQAEDLACSILQQIDAWHEKDDQAIRRAWLDRAHPAGTELRVCSPAGERTGRFAGLSPSGFLLLDGETQPIISAELSYASAAPAPAPCS